MSHEQSGCRRTVLSKGLAALTAGILLMFGHIALADNMMMARTTQTFPEAMSELQELILAKGYVVSRVQRVDIGLTTSGYKTDKYRVVFYGKPEEIRQLSQHYPELTPYLPLKISIFAEDKDTILVTANPQHLNKGGNDELAKVINRWEADLVEIFRKMRESN